MKKLNLLLNLTEQKQTLRNKMAKKTQKANLI